MNLTEKEIGFIMASMIGTKFSLLEDIAKENINEITYDQLTTVLIILDKLKGDLMGETALNIAQLHKHLETEFKEKYGMTSQEILLSLASKYNNGGEFN